MNTLAIITKIELKKLFQRKDSWLMFTILLVPILYSVGLASNSDVITYTGAGNITALGFASAMFQMSQSMFIFNVILSAIVGRSLASEIENKSIRLYINRIGIRKLIYGGKELALLIFSVFIDFLFILTSIVFYYAVLVRNPKVASGIFYDSNIGNRTRTPSYLFQGLKSIHDSAGCIEMSRRSPLLRRNMRSFCTYSKTPTMS